MDSSNPIILIDSDEETEPRSMSNSKQVIYIDLSDDDSDSILSTFNKKKSTFKSKDTYDPLTAELEYILQTPLSTFKKNSNTFNQAKTSLGNQNYLSYTDTINRSRALSPIPKFTRECSPVRPIHQHKRPRQEQSVHHVQNSFDTSSNYTQSSSQRRKKPVDSPFNRRPVLKEPKVDDSKIKEKELEDALEQFVSTISSTRFKQTTRPERLMCCICHVNISISCLSLHRTICKIKKVTRKKTIAEAVAKDENERKRRNRGKEETAPTNYYLESDEVFAADGVGFNESASGTTWEYAGQTHFG